MSGTLPASLSALTALISMCALARLPALSQCILGRGHLHKHTRARVRAQYANTCRDLGNNGIFGTLPASLSALTALQELCAPPARARRANAGAAVCTSAHAHALTHAQIC